MGSIFEELEGQAVVNLERLRELEKKEDIADLCKSVDEKKKELESIEKLIEEREEKLTEGLSVLYSEKKHGIYFLTPFSAEYKYITKDEAINKVSGEKCDHLREKMRWNLDRIQNASFFRIMKWKREGLIRKFLPEIRE